MFVEGCHMQRRSWPLQNVGLKAASLDVDFLLEKGQSCQTDGFIGLRRGWRRSQYLLEAFNVALARGQGDDGASI